jgi:hypothetical protein
MSLSCWIRSAFVKGWKEDDWASPFDGEDIVPGFGCGNVRRTGNEDGLFLKSEKHASKFFGFSRSCSNEEECGSAGKVH